MKVVIQLGPQTKRIIGLIIGCTLLLTIAFNTFALPPSFFLSVILPIAVGGLVLSWRLYRYQSFLPLRCPRCKQVPFKGISDKGGPLTCMREEHVCNRCGAMCKIRVWPILTSGLGIAMLYVEEYLRIDQELKLTLIFWLVASICFLSLKEVTGREQKHRLKGAHKAYDRADRYQREPVPARKPEKPVVGKN